MQVLLVEPAVRRQHPNLGLLKISSFHRERGDSVVLVRHGGRGQARFDTIPAPDVVYASGIFTYYSKKFITMVRSTMRAFPHATVRVGGVYPSLLPEHVKEHTGIEPHVGLLPEVDKVRPDYGLIPVGDRFASTSLLFSTRGCPNKCRFCYVSVLEPDLQIMDGWQEHIDPTHRQIIFYDNNISAHDAKHRGEVFTFLARKRTPVLFDNGFDVTKIDETHADEIASANHIKLRLALDRSSIQSQFERAVSLLVARGRLSAPPDRAPSGE